MCGINVCAFAWKGQRTTSLSLDTAHLDFILLFFVCFLRQGLSMAWNLLGLYPLDSAFLVLKSQMHAMVFAWGSEDDFQELDQDQPRLSQNKHKNSKSPCLLFLQTCDITHVTKSIISVGVRLVPCWSWSPRPWPWHSYS